MDGISQIFGIVIAFALAIVMNMRTYNNLRCLLLWLNLFIAFMVWCSILEDWIFILSFLVCVVFLIIEYKTKIGKGGNNI